MVTDVKTQPVNTIESANVNPLGKTIVAKLLQLLKADDPIDVIVFGIVKLNSPEHNLNAADPIDVKLAGNVSPVNPEQFANTLPPRDVRESGIISVPVNPLQ